MKRQQEFSKKSTRLPQHLAIKRAFLRFAHAMIVASLLLTSVGISPAAASAAEPAEIRQQALATDLPETAASQDEPNDEVPVADFEQLEIPAAQLPGGAPAPEFAASETDDTAEIKGELHQRPRPVAAPVDPLVATSAITLTLAAAPSFVTPGGRVNLSWQIAGLDDFSKETALIFSLPAGFSPLNNSYGVYDPQSGELTVPVTSPSGNLILVRAEGIESGLFTITARLEQEQAAQAAAALQLETLVIIPPAGGEATGLGGRVRLIVPAGAASEAVAVRIRTPDGSSPIPYSLSGSPFEIIAKGQSSGQLVRQFQQPLTIHVSYAEGNLWGEELGLTLFYFDEALRAWRPLLTHVDAENNLLSAQTDHLTNFDIDIQSWQSSRLPSLDGFQVSDFTGAATYAYPIWTPPGPGGLQPSLSLTYSSQVVDGANFRTQASWVGMGWSLDTGYIERDIHDTNDDTSDDTYTLILNGASHLLLPGADGYYHTSDESFLRVERYTAGGADHWIVRDKTGSQYMFGDTDESRATYPVFNYGVYPCDFDGHRTWRWSLRTVRNIFGQELTYSYDTAVKAVDYRDCSDHHQNTTVAVYPKTIDYSNIRYRVWFERVNDRGDYDPAWATDPYSLAFYQTERLVSIQIQHDANGDGVFEQVVRKYVFTYATSGQVFPNRSWEAGGKTLTLAKVQEYGTNGDRLPATTFTYGDGMHLTRADNGYGGRVEFVYEASPWGDLDAPKSRKVEQDFGLNFQPCEFDNDNTGGWFADTSGSSVRCDNDNLQITGLAKKWFPTEKVQPGGKYRLYARMGRASSQNTTAKVGITDYGAQWSYSPAQTISTVDVSFDWTVDLVKTAGGALALIDCSAYACDVDTFKLHYLPIAYRVTQKKVYDGINASPQVFTYRYDGPATNDPAHSAAASSYDFPDNLYNPEFSEFRGHTVVEETGPGTGPLVTTTWFHQDDGKKGRPHTTVAGTRKFTEAFESMPGGTQWTLTHSGSNQTLERLEGDNALKSNNPNNDWNVQLARPANTLVNDDAVLAQFRVSGYSSGLSTETVLSAESGTLNTSSYRRWGVYVKTDKSMVIRYIYNYSGGVYSISDYALGMELVENAWYQLLLVLDNESLSARVWRRDDPSTAKEVSVAAPPTITSATKWSFKQWSKHGTVWLDEYAEGKIYSVSVTGYNPDPQSHAPVDKSGLANFHDLAIAWTRVDFEKALNFEGDGDFTATASFYKYEEANQGNLQFGNLTRRVDSGWNGSSFTDYRTTLTRYYPNSAAYLVGLPGWSNQYKCPSGTNGSCATSAAADLVSSDIFIYDSQGTDYTKAPLVGKLTQQRTLKKFTDPVAFTGPKYSDVALGYDAWGNQISVTRYSGEGSATAFASAGAQTTTTCFGQEGSGTSCLDDGYHVYPGWVKDAKGFVTSVLYDKALGVVIKETDPNGAITQAQYDAFGRLTKVARHGDTLTAPTFQFIYADANKDSLAAPFQVEQSQKTSHSLRYTLRTFYNGLGQAIQLQTIGAQVNGTDQDILTDIAYDGYGREIKRSVPYPVSLGTGYRTPAAQPYTRTVYDALGRKTEVSLMNASGGLVNVLEKYEYVDLQVIFTDANQSKEADPAKTTTTYDGWGRVSRIDLPTANPWVTYQYDILDRITEVNYGGAVTGGIAYDYLGNRTKQTDPDMGAWAYDYDAVGNLITQSDAKGCITSIAYDALNRLTSKTYSGTGCPATDNVTYTYDASDPANGNYGKGRRTGMVSGTVTKTWKYDLLGHTAEELLQIGTDKFLTRWSYNTAGQLLSLTYPGDLAGGAGEKVNYTYLRQNVVDDARNSAATPQVYVDSSSYDAAGRMTARVVGPSRFTATYTYFPWTTVDGLGRLQKVTSGSYQDLRFTYDANGNVLTIADWKAGSPQAQTFTYDNLNRLSSAVASGGTSDIGDYPAESYSYDTSGTLVSVGGATNGYGTLPAECATGSFIPTHAVTTSGAWKFCYDQNGNQIKRVKTTSPIATYNLNYDINNRLVSVSGSASETYIYDGDSNLVKKVDSSGTTFYVGNYFEAFIPTPSVPTSTPTPTGDAARFTQTPTSTPSPTATHTPTPPATSTPTPTTSSGGGGVTFAEVVTGGSSGLATVATSGNLTGVAGDLYLAAISTRYARVTVESITGLGLSWTPVRIQCAGRNQTGVEVWKAQGTPTGDGVVTAQLSSAPTNAAIVVSHYSGVDPANPIGNLVSGNTLGVDGACDGGVDSSAYSFNLSTSMDGTFVFGAVAMRQAAHTPGAGYTERAKIYQGSGGSTVGLAVEDKRVDIASAAVLDGTFGSEADWAVIGLEILPSNTSARPTNTPLPTATSTPLATATDTATPSASATPAPTDFGGGGIAFAEIQTGGSTSASSITTSASLTAVSGALYLAAISTKPGGIAVESLSGLGLAWTPVRSQCAGRNQTGVEVWMAQGTPGGDGAVTASLASAPSNAVIAVARYSGVDPASPLGNLVSGNTNGVDGVCSDGIDSSAYSFNLTTTVDQAMVYVAVAPRMRDNTPGAAYTERAEVFQGSSGTAGVSIADGTVAAISTVLVDGTLSSETDWAVIAVEIMPGSGGMGQAAGGTSLASADAALPAATNYQSNVASRSPLSAAGNLIGRLWSWLAGQLNAVRNALAPRPVSAAPPPGVVFRSYYYVGGQRVAMRVEGESDPARNGLFYTLSDHLGSTTVTLKDTGSLSKVSELRYKPWGLTRGSGYADSLTPTDRRFTGQRWEGGTGLYHFKARWYDPLTGRFTQPDTIVPDPGNPQDWDRYVYVRNNPLVYTDPTGHWSEEQLDKALGKGWRKKYFGEKAIFQNRSKLLEFLASKNTTDTASLALVSSLFNAAYSLHSNGIDFSNIDAVGMRISGSGGGLGYVGAAADAILNLTSGELGIFGSLEGGFMAGASVTVVGGITLITNMPANSGFRDTAKAVGGMGGAIIGVNIEGFSGGEHYFQDSSDVAHGLFIGIGGTIHPPNAGIYGSLSYAVEVLNVDQAGYSVLPNYPGPVRAAYNAVVDLGEILWHDILNIP